MIVRVRLTFEYEFSDVAVQANRAQSLEPLEAVAEKMARLELFSARKKKYFENIPYAAVSLVKDADKDIPF